jgi:hypothetical protein
VQGISVGRVKGTLTDHFHPAKRQVNLSNGVYGDNSVAAIAVAAHEIGHVVQKQRGYLPYKIRTALVPLTNIGSYLALPLVWIGVVLDLWANQADYGCYGALVGAAWLLLDFSVQPMYIFTEWVPDNFVEWSSITKVFWNLVAESAKLVRIGTRELRVVEFWGGLLRWGLILALLGAALLPKAGIGKRQKKA